VCRAWCSTHGRLDRRRSPARGLLACANTRAALPRQTPREPATKQAAESTYKFLDRVDGPVFARVRETLNAWFDRFAKRQVQAAVADLRGRLRAKRPLQFDAAFWELYLHELHARLGYQGYEAELHGVKYLAKKVRLWTRLTWSLNDRKRVRRAGGVHRYDDTS
jgi:hypothetical protein